jgi:hypothetical protein
MSNILSKSVVALLLIAGLGFGSFGLVTNAKPSTKTSNYPKKVAKISESCKSMYRERVKNLNLIEEHKTERFISDTVAMVGVAGGPANIYLMIKKGFMGTFKTTTSQLKKVGITVASGATTSAGVYATLNSWEKKKVDEDLRKQADVIYKVYLAVCINEKGAEDLPKTASKTPTKKPKTIS